MYRSLLIPLRLSNGVRDTDIPTEVLVELFRHQYKQTGVHSSLLLGRALQAASPYLSTPEDAERHYYDLAANGHHVRLPDGLKTLMGEQTRGILIAIPNSASQATLNLRSTSPDQGSGTWIEAAKHVMDQVLGPNHAVAIGYPVGVENAITALTRVNHAGAFIESLPATLARAELELNISTHEIDDWREPLQLRVTLTKSGKPVHQWVASQASDENHLEAAYALSLHAQAHGFDGNDKIRLKPQVVRRDDHPNTLQPT